MTSICRQRRGSPHRLAGIAESPGTWPDAMSGACDARGRSIPSGIGTQWGGAIAQAQKSQPPTGDRSGATRGAGGPLTSVRSLWRSGVAVTRPGETHISDRCCGLDQWPCFSTCILPLAARPTPSPRTGSSSTKPIETPTNDHLDRPPCDCTASSLTVSCSAKRHSAENQPVRSSPLGSNRTSHLA